jgi:O-antigen chain-terminating methyltransferase
MKNDTEFDDLFNRIDNAFVGTEEHVYSYQSKYAGYFKKGDLVLDIGCGQGAFLRALKESGINGVGIDMNSKNASLCNDKGYNVYRADMFQFLRESDNLGGIFAGHVIEHFSGYEAVSLLKTCYDALGNGKPLVLLTPNFADDHIHRTNFWLSATPVRPYPLEWLQVAFREIGFTVLSCGYDYQGGDTFIVGVK